MPDFVRGDATGLAMPAHAEALRSAGEDFLTAALRTSGRLRADNRVSRIVRCEPCAGGSTGHKLFLGVEYAHPRPGLDEDLFVKFSRDFSDPLRDQGRHEMESEVRLAALSRHPDFPIAVASNYFADYQAETGTGLLITSRVAFGHNGIQPQLIKCADHKLADPLAYYRAILPALARLAAAHKSGKFGGEVDRLFPFDPELAAAADPIAWDKDMLRGLVQTYRDFAARCPRLLPQAVTTPEFVAGFEKDALRVLRHEAAIKRFIHADADYIALCHWNAQLDNAWFWHDVAGELRCGLIDWGRVRQMNLAYALWGCLVGADVWVWERHLDELLSLFLTEFHAHGGPYLEPARLKLHLQLYAATIGVAGILIAPERILLRLPEAESASGPFDPVFDKSEEARGFLHILTVFISFWRTSRLGASLDQLFESQ
jgi:hypothetical protein